MRKLIVSSLMSADGVVGDPQAWATRHFDLTDVEVSIQVLRGCHAMLMGRGMFEYFAPVWGPADNPYAEELRRLPKLVFSSNPLRGDWKNAVAAGHDPIGTVRELKSAGDGGDLILYGLTRLAGSLLHAGLVDELRLAVHPLLVGAGAPPFRAGQAGDLQLARTTVRRSGVVDLTYVTA